MEKNRLHKRIAIILLVLICIPIFTKVTGIKLSGSLSKADNVNSCDKLSLDSWFSGSFQSSYENYINDNIGQFAFFIRLHNQIEYSLFDKVHTGNVVHGVKNYLFEKIYINSIQGKDFIGSSNARSKTKDLKQLQDTLATMGKSFMVCIASGKASYYPEYIPNLVRTDSTNSNVYASAFKKQGVNHINTIDWFLKMKDSLGHYLFPKYGIHWSNFGAILVTDSIVKYHETKFNWDLPNLKITSYETSKKTRFFDNDIARSMNLFVDIEPFPYMKYPLVEWEKSNSYTDRKKILIIGDSFTWDIYKNSGIASECFITLDLWYYNQTANNKIAEDGSMLGGLPVLTRHLNLTKVINDYDGFIIISSEPNLSDLGWNIAENLLGTLRDSTYQPEERNNAFILSQCLDKKEWREDLEKMAEKRNITLDSMISIYLHDRNFKLDK
jgi:hypothetical protein